MQTRIRPHRTRCLIRICTVYLNNRKLWVKWNSLKSPFSQPTLRDNRPISAVSALIFIPEETPYEPQWEKSYFLTWAPNEDSNQPAHPRSLISQHCPHEEAIQNAPSETSDQTAWMHRLTWVFVWRTIPKVRRTIPKVRFGRAGLGGSAGCAVRLETKRLRVQPPPRSATFFRGDWSWNIFYGHSLPSADSRRAVVSFWRKNVHNTG